MTYIVWMLRSLDCAPTAYTVTYIVWMLRSLDSAHTRGHYDIHCVDAQITG